MKKYILALLVSLLPFAVAADTIVISWDHVTQQELGRAIPADDIEYAIVYEDSSKPEGWWGLMCWQSKKWTKENSCEHYVAPGSCVEAIVLAIQPSTTLRSKPSNRVKYCAPAHTAPAAPTGLTTVEEK